MTLVKVKKRLFCCWASYSTVFSLSFCCCRSLSDIEKLPIYTTDLTSMSNLMNLSLSDTVVVEPPVLRYVSAELKMKLSAMKIAVVPL